jgi:cation diffusion facilitator CzcD-associated flavoprotein CzcO
MSFWDRNMPFGMLLRSNWTATTIAHPEKRLTLDAFRDATGNHFSTPVSLERFVAYGLWYQHQAVPDVDRRKIERIDSESSGFRLDLEDGEIVKARRVVIAAGIASFAWRPPEFQHLPSGMVSHTSEHRDLRGFSGKQVLVIGGGQSALESAALLHEGGADVEIISRAAGVHWLQGSLSKTLHHRMGRLTSRLLYAPTDVGPACISQLVARPDMLRRLPRSVQDRIRLRSVRPAGARWLVSRLRQVPIRFGRSVVSAAAAGDRVKVRVDDGTERTVHHAFLGTGYKVDIAKYGFLSPGLRESIKCYKGYPRLEHGLETSVPGLHILGAPAAWSFGPLMQFVSGTHYACQELARRIAG